MVCPGYNYRIIFRLPAIQVHHKFGTNVGDQETISDLLKFEELGTGLVWVQDGAYDWLVVTRDMSYRSGCRAADEIDAAAKVGSHFVL